MKHIATILFCLITYHSLMGQDRMSENAADYLDSAVVAMRNKNFTQAVQYRQQALAIFQKQKPRDDSLLINVKFEIGYAYYAQLQLDSALAQLKRITIDHDLDNDKLPFGMKIYAWLGIISSKAGNKLEAINYLEKGISLAKLNRHSYLELIQCHRVLGATYLGLNKTEKAKEYIEKGINVCELNPNCTKRASYVFMLNTAGLIQNKLLNHDKALNYYTSGINQIVQHPENKVMAKALPLLYGNIGGVYRDLGDHKRGIEWCKKAIEHSKKGKHKLKGLDVAVWLERIGVIYSRGGFHEKAIPYFEQAIYARKGTPLESGLAQAGSYHLLGKAYLASEKKIKAIDNIKNALSIAENIAGPNSVSSQAPLRDLGIAHNYNGDWILAEKYLQRVLTAQINETGLDINNIATTHLALAELYQRQGRAVETFRHFEKALSLKKKFYGNQKLHYWDIYRKLGKTYVKLRQFDEAEHYFNQAYDAIRHDDIATQLKHSTQHLTPIIEIQLEKAALRIRQFNDNNTHLQYLLDALNENKVALESYERLLENCNDGDCLKIGGPSLSEVLKQALHITFLLKKEGLSTKNQEKLFYYLEKSKSAFMRSNILNIEDRTNTNIPQTILDHIHDGNIRVAYFEKKLFHEQYAREQPRDSLVELFKTNLFKHQNIIDSFIAVLNTDYPNYYKINYSSQVVSVHDVQEQLTSSQVLVEYLVSDSTIYAFILTQDKFKIKEVRINFDLSQSVSELRNSIYAYWMESNNSDTSYLNAKLKYVYQAHLLYEKLIGFLDLPQSKKLVVIPDGVLNYIPFDALLTQKSPDNKGYREQAYMINHYEINSCYSATLWNELRESTNTTSGKKVLCMSPDFPFDSVHHDNLVSIRGGLGHLENNVSEAVAIGEIFDADIVKGQEATAAYFKANANSYDVVHLSTHAKANDKMGDYSFIAFTNTGDSMIFADRLYARDLYNLNLDNVDMVVLSACETGLGELKDAEGIVGMTRGFTFAGANSTVTSLWSVDDAQTAYLMKQFYSYLKEGNEKGAALRLAKLDLIKNGAHADPYFWAGFVVSGNMKPISHVTNGSKYYYLVFGVFLLATVLGLKRWATSKKY